MKKIFLLCIRLYKKWISPLLGDRCRFYPSCSTYAKEAFEKKNWIYALFLTLKRLGKCAPWHPGGYDPLP